jgi:amino acid transporter
LAVAKIDQKRMGWAFFWISLGAAALIGAIAAPALPAWSIAALLAIAGIGFTVSAYYFRRLGFWKFLFIWGLVSLVGYSLWPPPNGRHLSRDQKEGLAKLRDGFPKQCGILVYVPDDSVESQNYGQEIQSGLQLHGAKANIVHEGVMPAPIGLVVGVRSSLEPCGYAGEMLSGGMDAMHMPARLVEGFPRADETVVVIFVGTKPPYD